MQDLAALFDHIELGAPIHAVGLFIFPVALRDAADVDYLTLNQALQAGEIDIMESERVIGSWFRSLDVHVKGTRPVLLRDADVLVGGRQDRVGDETILLPAGTWSVPVSCVEANRSSYRSPRPEPGRQYTYRDGRDPSAHFEVSQTAVHSDLRAARARKHHVEGRTDQMETWHAVAEVRTSEGLSDGGGSLHESHERRRRVLAGELEKVELPAARGVLVVDAARPSEPLMLELFGTEPACQAAWRGLVFAAARRHGVARLDAQPPSIEQAATAIRALLTGLETKSAATRGLGRRYSYASARLVGSSLWVDGKLGHCALTATPAA